MLPDTLWPARVRPPHVAGEAMKERGAELLTVLPVKVAARPPVVRPTLSQLGPLTVTAVPDVLVLERDTFVAVAGTVTALLPLITQYRVSALVGPEIGDNWVI